MINRCTVNIIMRDLISDSIVGPIAVILSGKVYCALKIIAFFNDFSRKVCRTWELNALVKLVLHERTLDLYGEYSWNSNQLKQESANPEGDLWEERAKGKGPVGCGNCKLWSNIVLKLKVLLISRYDLTRMLRFIVPKHCAIRDSKRLAVDFQCRAFKYTIYREDLNRV